MLSVLLFIFALAQASPAPPQPGDRLVVVELFTSQGCPMCPEANALLGDLSQDGGVLTLAYGVGYWDVYGWTDEFAKPEFAARQQAYVDAGEPRRVYTPHFVVNGGPEKMRFDAARVRETVASASPLPALMRVQNGALALDGPARDRAAQIWRVEYAPGRVERAIGGGPNAGRAMVHHDMVTAIAALGDWTGGPLSLPVDPAEDGRAVAILLQDGPGGRLLAAVRAD